MINKPVHVPAVGQSGLNSGVLFIKLDRIRTSNFLELVEETAEKFKPNLIGAEQDVLNIIFNNFPSKFTHFILPLNIYIYFPIQFRETKIHRLFV
jgi:lipopolysaccharide biosynthesis glycosyltransferase